MRIDQANSGASVTINAGSKGYSVDQWYGYGTASAGVFTLQQQSASPPLGFTTYLRATVGTADASPASSAIYVFANIIEGVNLPDFQLGTANAISFTMSFWIRSSVAGSYSGSLKNGAINRSYPFSFTINSANTWEYKTVTVSGDTTGTWAVDNTAGLAFHIDLGSGASYRTSAGTWAAGDYQGVTGAVRLISTASATLDVTGVQIESGTNATVFERRNFGAEVMLCKRYYRRVGSHASGKVDSTTAVVFSEGMETPMRVAPTPTIVNSTITIRTNANDVTSSGSTLVFADTKVDGWLVGTDGFTGLTPGQATPERFGQNMVALDARL